MNKKEQMTLKDCDKMLDFPLGVLTVIISDTIEVLEEIAGTDDSEDLKNASWKSYLCKKKIEMKIQKDSFWEENDDIEQILNICDTFTKEERTDVLFALDSFLGDLDESMQKTHGKT